MIRIMNQNIGFCRACDGYVRNGGICILKDDMAGILDFYQKVVVLVLAEYYGVARPLYTVK